LERHTVRATDGVETILEADAYARAEAGRRIAARESHARA
jgi:hypothetical protein